MLQPRLWLEAVGLALERVWQLEVGVVQLGGVERNQLLMECALEESLCIVEHELHRQGGERALDDPGGLDGLGNPDDQEAHVDCRGVVVGGQRHGPADDTVVAHR
jgi:hypothetical protein